MSLELQREEVVQQLCHHYAHDRLSTQELEARLDAVYRAGTLEELGGTLMGLPAIVGPVSSSPSHATLRTSSPESAAEGRILTVFGSVKKRGEWEPAPTTRAIAVFAELELDFRSALLRPGVTTVNISATFAEVRIIVPPGLRVECDGSAIFGEFSAKSFGAPSDDDTPMVRITGQVVFGEVKVLMRLPDENSLQAFKREWLG